LNTAKSETKNPHASSGFPAKLELMFNLIIYNCVIGGFLFPKTSMYFYDEIWRHYSIIAMFNKGNILYFDVQYIFFTNKSALRLTLLAKSNKMHFS